MLLLRMATEKSLPFKMKVPNPSTVKAMPAVSRGQGRGLSTMSALLKDLGI